MGFDHRRLRLGEQIAGICAVLLFIDLFLPWYSASLGFASASASGWQAFSYTDLLLLLLIIVTLGLLVLTATQRAPALPIAGSVIVTVFAGLMALLVLYRMINQVGPNNLVSVEWGAYIGFLLTCGIAYGGFRAMRDEGTGLGAARAQAEGLLRDRRTTGSGAATTTGSTASPAADTAPPAAAPAPAETAPPVAGSPPPPPPEPPLRDRPRP